MICNASVWSPLAGNNQFTQKTFSGEFLELRSKAPRWSLFKQVKLIWGRFRLSPFFQSNAFLIKKPVSANLENSITTIIYGSYPRFLLREMKHLLWIVCFEGKVALFVKFLLLPIHCKNGFLVLTDLCNLVSPQFVSLNTQYKEPRVIRLTWVFYLTKGLR